MNQIYYILIACAIAALLTFFLFPVMIKRGINMSGIFGTATSTLAAMQSLMDILKVATPGKFDLMAKILEYAKVGVDAAEQLYKASQLAADQRRAYAISTAYECLGFAGIEVTDEIKSLIDKFIESSVFALPPTNPKSKTKTKT